MSSYLPPDEILTIFNAINYLYGNANLTLFDAQSMFLSLTGGTLSGSLYAPNIFVSGSIGGTLTTAAQPNITSVGTLTSLSLNTSSISLSQTTGITGTCIWTGGAQPTTTNGIGLRFNGMADGGTGYLRSYNYILNQDNNMTINNGNIYIKNDRNIGIDVARASIAYKLDVNGDINTNGNFRVNGSILTGISSAQATLLSATPGTATASKALIFDASVNIGNINKVTISGTDASTSYTTGALIVAGGIGASDQVSCLKLATATVATTNLNLGGYNAVCDGADLSKTRISIDGVVYANKCLISDSNQKINSLQGLQMGNSSDTTSGRWISAYGAMSDNTTASFSLGVSNTDFNHGALTYRYVSNNNNQNEICLSSHTQDLLRCRYDGAILNGSQILISSAGAFTGSDGVRTTGPLNITARNGYGLSHKSSPSGSHEIVTYVDATYCQFGTYTNHTLDILVNGSIHSEFTNTGRLNILGGSSYLGGGNNATYLQPNSSTLQYIAGWTGSTTISLWCNNGIVAFGNIIALSDRRLKSDIVYSTEEDKERIIAGMKNIRPCTYKMKGDDGFGYIAQELIANKLTEVIHMDEDENAVATEAYDCHQGYWGITYSKMGGYHTICIQDLYKKIEHLEEQVDMLHKILENNLRLIKRS